MQSGLRLTRPSTVQRVVQRWSTSLKRNFVALSLPLSFRMASNDSTAAQVGTAAVLETEVEAEPQSKAESDAVIDKHLPQRPAAVLFDIDGTLTHSDHLHLTVFQELLLELEYPLPEDPCHVQRLDSGVDVISEGMHAPTGHCSVSEAQFGPVGF
eukprot:INCI6233.6.p1 GENE.INCI6233.6~~INCI6233.6.p1  ORF type:complete len:155 (+),score=27.36 INCI6233.6:249-713(+)